MRGGGWHSILLQIAPVVFVRGELFEFILDLGHILELAGGFPVAAAQFDEGRAGIVVGRAALLGAGALGGLFEHCLHRLDLFEAHVHRIEMFDDRGVHVVLFCAGASSSSRSTSSGAWLDVMKRPPSSTATVRARGMNFDQ